jgi:molecular chaperone HscB
MNYFEIFDIPIQLKVDKSDLPRRYFELNKKFHPDYYANATPAEQEQALNITASLNKAYRIFQNTDETIKYVLQLKGMLKEEEKYQLPPLFLMEVLEINEQLMDMKTNEQPELKENIQSSILRIQSSIYEPVKTIIEGYREGLTTEKELLQVKEYYYKKKYLDKINRELTEK